MRVLVVEGQRLLAQQMRNALAEQGHVVDMAFDGARGLDLVSEGAHDLLLLDDQTPGLPSPDRLGNLGGSRHALVVMLSSEDDPDARARGLRLGVDDYIVKPFSLSELVARVQALTRRSGAHGQIGDRLSLGDLELDLMRRQATREGRRLDLSAQEFMLLSTLMRMQGTVLSRADLLDQLWGSGQERDSNVVDVAIRRLRAKIDAPFGTKLLHTVRGAGYILELRGGNADSATA